MKHFCIFLFFALVLALGAWLGQTLQPQNNLLRGKLGYRSIFSEPRIIRSGHLVIYWEPAAGGQIIIESNLRPGFPLWQSLAGQPFLQAANAQEKVSESRGMFQMRDSWQEICPDQQVEFIRQDAAGVEIGGTLRCSSGRRLPFSLVISGADENYVDLNAAVAANRIFLTYASDPQERFFGFGEQFTYAQMKGRRVPIWVSEQGVGRGEEPITSAANLTNGGAGGSAFTTYAPLPFYLTSQGRGAFFLNQDYQVFDLRSADRVQVSAWAGGLYAHFYTGATPAHILTQFSAENGRMAPLPDWVMRGAIVGMQGGTQRVREVYEQLTTRQTPLAAFWLQDWVGQRRTSFGKQLWWNWELDQERYPEWPALTAALAQDNVAVMLYFNPYLADIGSLKPGLQRNLFQEAKQKGYLVKNASGEPYLVLNTDFRFGMIDLTNPEAWNWYRQIIEEQVQRTGARGWMADFGEGLPYDAVVANRQDSAAGEMHNSWPVFWAALNRQVADDLGGEKVFFSRAAFSGSPYQASLFWEGDQLVSWSEFDGLRSAITGLNTSGISGMAFNHSDIGGYTTISSPIKNYHRSRELLYRWMEMSAFTPIFRTHEGNQPENNVQFYTDAETLDTFARWAKVYAALFEYRKVLAQEASQTGLPMVRHPFLLYPQDPETWGITYQEFFLGDDFLVAPVTEAGATQLKVYFPAGEWVHLWSGKFFSGGSYQTVDAPLGVPAVFYRQGSPWGEDLARELGK